MDYDLAVIGAGWAGFNASLRARDLGLKVALIEKDELGGSCLNRGCIPTKTLIQSAKVYNLTKKSSSFGIDIPAPAQINFSKIQERKDRLIQQLRLSMQSTLRGINLFNGLAQFVSSRQLRVANENIKAKFILIASGSRPMELEGFKFDGKKIVSSDEILNLKDIPCSLLIIGGGIIGCEFANLFSSLGSKVFLIEKMPQILPGEDKEVAKKLELIFKKKGIQIMTNTDANAVNLQDYELVLVCVGRTPNLEDLSLDSLGLRLERKRIVVDEYLKTDISNIYAAGDCAAKTMLAHFASYQGNMAAHNIVFPDRPHKIVDTAIPKCIYTDPEIASIGIDEDEARNRGIETKVYKFDFLASGMARILDETDGFIKIISDKKTGQIQGASIIGPRATEIIGILTLAVSTRLKISQIQDTIFAHPTISEAISDTFAKSYGV